MTTLCAREKKYDFILMYLVEHLVFCNHCSKIKLNVVVYSQLFITILALKYAQSFYNHFISQNFHIKRCHSTTAQIH